ncbi:hypothetical protein [Echinicola vietnamensis]|uniref:Uncharacterized protein n=1 Tax=Echinicola vietnamensis (strain DSM 17526 / LMG 23754 / KMM 6221) TaxID=926556 RepID=L0G3K4_ECHVK|nr:hypothetical protein [Echinicola vietnamensis]AGA80092.1 hypothetical protein Echvi_3880 [Echinicola vietnamensis DSM 17526]
MVLFTGFIFTPIVVTIIDAKTDVSMFYSVVEEEENAENHKTEKSTFFKRNEMMALSMILADEEISPRFHLESDYAFVMGDQFCPPPEFS